MIVDILELVTCFRWHALPVLAFQHVLCLADEPIHFALLIPFSGLWDGGKRIAGAAALAVERINSDNVMLPGHMLEYHWADSGCSAQQGLVAMGELLGGANRVDAVIGMQLPITASILLLRASSLPIASSA